MVTGTGSCAIKTVAVSRSAASGGRYSPIESTKVVSRLARAKSDASAESAAMSSRVRDGLPPSQAAANAAIPIIINARNELDPIIILTPGAGVICQTLSFRLRTCESKH